MSPHDRVQGPHAVPDCVRIGWPDGVSITPVTVTIPSAIVGISLNQKTLHVCIPCTIRCAETGRSNCSQPGARTASCPSPRCDGHSLRFRQGDGRSPSAEVFAHRQHEIVFPDAQWEDQLVEQADRAQEAVVARAPAVGAPGHRPGARCPRQLPRGPGGACARGWRSLTTVSPPRISTQNSADSVDNSNESERYRHG